MDRTKVKGYLNIAHKAGYLIIGSDNLRGYDKKLYLVLVDKTAGKNSKKIALSFEEKGLKAIEIDNLEELSSIPNCKIVGIKNKQLTEKIIEFLEI